MKSPRLLSFSSILLVGFFLLVPQFVFVEANSEGPKCENITFIEPAGDKQATCQLAGSDCVFDTASGKCKIQPKSTITPTTRPNPDVSITFPNPLAGNAKDPHKVAIPVVTLIAKIISGLLGILGSISLLIFLIGGVLYLVSQGEESKIKKSIDTLKWALLGLVVVFSAYALLNMILKGLEFITTS